jgi:4,5-dihydroxyphthalate decarboxylase
MPGPALRTVTRTQGNNAALKDGTVVPRGFTFAFEEVNPLIDAFRRMVRGLEFDVCEMSLTTYVTARAHGIRFTALPIFIVRQFHHGATLVNANGPVHVPKDLEGRRAGVNRGYTVTTGVWARGVLSSQYGVDLDRVTWVLSGDEHVASFRPPANVVPIEPGKKMSDLLISGELPAAIGVEVEHPDVRPLIADPLEAGLRALREHGHYPINHLIVMRDDVLAEHPDVAPAIFEAFAESKRIYLDRLRSGVIEKPTPIDELHRRVMAITGDPLPYGVEPNRGALEELLRHAHEQHIIDTVPPVESLFAANTVDLTG